MYTVATKGGIPVKIIINKSPTVTETEISITCSTTAGLENIIAALGMLDRRLAGRLGDETVFVELDEVLRLESVDGRSFFYTACETYEYEGSLADMEKATADTLFTRVSKSAIINLRHVKSIKKVPGSRLLATLDNGEGVTVSRMYMPEIKRRLGI